MTEYIKREAVLALAEDYEEVIDDGADEIFFEYIPVDKVRSIPADDVRPVVRGFNKLKDYPSLFECSVCGWECGDTVPGDTETYNFCPNCGADMREES